MIPREASSTSTPPASFSFEYSSAEVVGANVTMLMPEPFQSTHDTCIRDYQLTGQRKIIGIGREVTGRHSNGTMFPMDLFVGEITHGEKRA